MDQEKRHLQESLEQSRTELAHVREQNGQEIHGLNEQIQRLTGESDAAKESYEQLRRDYETHQAQAENAMQQLQERLLNEEQKYQSETQRLHSELSTLRDQFEHEKHAYSERIELMAQEKQHLQEAMERAHIESSDAQEQENQTIQSLRDQILLLSDQSVSLNEKYEQMRHEYEAYQTQSEGEIGHLNEQRQSLQQEIERLRQSTSELKHEADAHKVNAEALSQAHQQIERLSAEHVKLTQLHEQSHSVSGENEVLQNRLNELQIQNNELAETLSGLRQQFDHMQASKQTQIDALQKQSDQFEQQLRNGEGIHASLRQLQEESARLREDNERLRGELLDLESQLRAYADSETTMRSDAVEKASLEPASEPIPEELRPRIPVYNLAEQIMSEHRRSVGARRQRVEPSIARVKSESIKDVVKHYVSAPAVPVNAAPGLTTSYHDLWNDDSLTSFQQELLLEITQKDILKYCGN